MKSRMLKQHTVLMYEIKMSSTNKYRPFFLNLLTQIQVKLDNIFPQPVLKLLLSFQPLKRACMLKGCSVFYQIYMLV